MSRHLTEHPSHVVKKRTIIKDRVGCVRTSTYHLPSDHHTYGMKTEHAHEGASELLSSWITTNPSLEKKTERMLVYSNVLAIKKGCITSKAMREYSIQHPNIRMKEVLVSDSARIDHKHEGPFGRKTEFSGDSIKDILQARFTDFRNEDNDYPSVSSIKKMGDMPAPRPTAASQAIMNARVRSQEVKPESHFTMKKFQKVKGTFEREREEAEAKRRGETTSHHDEEDPATA